jgi:hypothetical protein
MNTTRRLRRRCISLARAARRLRGRPSGLKGRCRARCAALSTNNQDQSVQAKSLRFQGIASRRAHQTRGGPKCDFART